MLSLQSGFCLLGCVLLSVSSSAQSFRVQELPRLLHPVDKDGTRSLGFGDFDGDGDVDVIVGRCAFNAQTRILLNDGKGGLIVGSASRLPKDKDPCTGSFGVGDVDSDGDLDIFVGQDGFVSATGNRLLINDGRGYFKDMALTQLPRPMGNGIGQDTVHLCDLDGDGDLDLLYGGTGGGLWSIEIYTNDGKGKFSYLPRTTPWLSVNVHGLDVGDIDGDGDPDIVATDLLSGCRVLINNGKAVFKEETKKRMPTRYWSDFYPRLFDMDSDGDLDLVVARLFRPNNGPRAQTQLYENDGKGNFKNVTSTRLPTDSDLTVAVRCADFDQNGSLDILLFNIATYTQGKGRSRLYLNNGKGSFRDVSTSWLPKNGRLEDCYFGGVQDLDGDGDPDILADHGSWLAPQDFLFFNLTRQLYAPSSASTTKAYTLYIYGEPGQYAWLLLGLAAKRSRIPPLGILGLDLSQSVIWPVPQLLDKRRVNSWSIPLPPGLRGKTIYSQALLLDPTRPQQSRLTNIFFDRLQ